MCSPFSWKFQIRHDARKKARAFYSRILCVVHGKHTRMLRAPVTCAAEIGFYLRSGFHVASGYYLFDSDQAIFDAG
jgi:hypothetical protein